METNERYDYLVVGAGLFGAVFAYLAHRAGKKVLVIEKRAAVGGNIRTERIEGIDVHLFGPHIFHTDDEKIWDFVNRFSRFNRFTYAPLANFKGKIYHLPLSLSTCYEIFGTSNPADAKRQVERECSVEMQAKDTSFETHSLRTIGRSLYKTLIKGYTEKLWNKDATLLSPYVENPSDIEYTFDRPMFQDRFQGIPEDGYSSIIDKLLNGIRVELNTDYLKDREQWDKSAEKIVYTGPLDALFNCSLGTLAYLSLTYKTKVMDGTNFQGTPVMYYTDRAVGYTRAIEHRHFMSHCNSAKTIVSFEYPKAYRGLSDEPYYPIIDTKNKKIAERYKALSTSSNIILGGRLGTFAPLSMSETIDLAFQTCQREGIRTDL